MARLNKKNCSILVELITGKKIVGKMVSNIFLNKKTFVPQRFQSFLGGEKDTKEDLANYRVYKCWVNGKCFTCGSISESNIFTGSPLSRVPFPSVGCVDRPPL